MKKIAVIGLGLIGGSLALELKKTSWATIYGIDKNPYGCGDYCSSGKYCT